MQAAKALLAAAIMLSPLILPAQPSTPSAPPLVVKNLPIAAEEVTTTSSILPDGTTASAVQRVDIVRSSAGSVRRDIRTLADSTDPTTANGSVYVVLHDEVNHKAVHLDPTAKIATVTSLGTWAKPYSASATLPAGASLVPPSQSLGFLSISGWMTTGTRQTVLFPAGTRSKSQAVTETIDTWYSPDLQTVLLTQIQESLGGSSVTALKQITASEPDPALFSLPQDYTVVNTGK